MLQLKVEILTFKGLKEEDKNLEEEDALQSHKEDVEKLLLILKETRGRRTRKE